MKNLEKNQKEKARQMSFGHGGLLIGSIGSLLELTGLDDGCLPVVRQHLQVHSPTADAVEEKLPFSLSDFVDLEAHAGNPLAVVFPPAVCVVVAAYPDTSQASVTQDRRVSVAVTCHFTQEVLPIVRFKVFTDPVKERDFLHTNSPFFVWRNCQALIREFTRLPPQAEGTKGGEPYFLKVLIIRTDYEVTGYSGISGRLAMIVRLWVHTLLSQAQLTIILAYNGISVKQ